MGSFSIDTFTANRLAPVSSRTEEKPSQSPPGPAKRSITGIAFVRVIVFYGIL